jgi:hypothetical protein
VSIAGDNTPRGLDLEPEWALKYWAWKSAQMSPVSPAFKIAVESRQGLAQTIDVPAGGDLAKGSPDRGNVVGTTAAEVAAAAFQRQTSTIYTLRLRGITIGEWTNEPVPPGLSFGWAPAPRPLLAFARDKIGPLVLLDDAGHSREVAGTRSALLPAWSADGARLAWLERKDNRHYTLKLADVRFR